MVKKRETKKTTKEERGMCNIGEALNYSSLSAYCGDSYATKLSAVYRAVDVIASSVAQLPIITKIRDIKGNGELIDSPLYRLINRRPDSRMTRFTWLYTNVASMLLRGDGINIIERDAQRNIINLKFVDRGRVSILHDCYNENVRYLIDGIEYEPQNILHFINYTTNGIEGISTIKAAANILEIAANTDETARGLFLGGANVGGILTVQGALTTEQSKRIKDSWQKAFSPATGNPNGIAVLEGNMAFQKVSMSAADAQLLQAREFNVVEIARFFGVSPVKLGDLSKSSYSTVEATQLSFLTDTLAPICEKMEEELEFKLCGEDIDIEFDTDKILRLDKTSQASYLTSLRNGGIMSTNEARASIGLPRVEGGDAVQAPLNMTNIEGDDNEGNEGSEDVGNNPTSADADGESQGRGLRSLIQQVLSRLRRIH